MIHGATTIELTFADGSKSPARDRQRAARARHRRRPRDDAARDAGPGDHRRPARGPAGQRGVRDGQPVRALRLDDDGRHLRRSTARSRCRDGGPLLTGLFQIDAAVNPGNSGGALIDRDGRVIGIVTALINPTKEDVFIGIGLAVPIDVAGGAAGLPPY